MPSFDAIADRPLSSGSSPFSALLSGACAAPKRPTYPTNPWENCCQHYGCLAADGHTRYYPTHLDFSIYTQGSCSQALNGGLLQATATRCDVLDPSDVDYCGGKPGCGDIVSDGCGVWTAYLCATVTYVWKIDPGSIPTCGPFIGYVLITCTPAPPEFPGVFNCNHLDTRKPRKSWIRMTVVVFRAKLLFPAKSCFCGPILEDGSQDCNWYYADGDCNLQTGAGLYNNSGPPPCPGGTSAYQDPVSGKYDCVCCSPSCPACVTQCIHRFPTQACAPGVQCCAIHADDNCACLVGPPADPAPPPGDPYWFNGAMCDQGVLGCPNLGATHALRYEWAFCLGCLDQDDLWGCDPYGCPPDTKNFGNFHVKIAACPQFLPLSGGGSAGPCEDGDYVGCAATMAGDYGVWDCPVVVGDPAAAAAALAV